MSGMSSYSGKQITNGGATAPTINFTNTLVNYEGNTTRVNQTSNAKTETIDFSLELDDYQLGKLTGAMDVAVSDVDNTHWYDSLLNGLCVAGATIGNTVVSLVEGIVSFVEAVVDAAVIVAGVAITAQIIKYDMMVVIASKIFGFEYKSVTKSLWCDAIMPFVGTDWTGKAFGAMYQFPPFNWMEEHSLGAFKREDGTGYKIVKGIGYTVGLVLATVATAGIAGAGAGAAGAAGTATSSATGLTALLSNTTTVSTIFSGLGGLGKGTQKAYKKLSDEQKQDLLSVGKTVAYGTVNGLIEAAAWYFTFGDGKNVLKDAFPKPFEAGANALNSVTGGINNALGTNLLFNKFTSQQVSKAFVQFSKTYASATLDYIGLGNNQSIGGYFKDVVLNKATLTNATIASTVSLTFDATLGPIVSKWGKGLAKLFGPSEKPATSGESLIEDFAVETADSPFAGSKWVPTEQVVEGISGGFGKVVGGFIKKLMDPRNALEIIRESIPNGA